MKTQLIGILRRTMGTAASLTTGIALLTLVAVLCPATSLGSSLFTFDNLTEDIGRGFGDSWNRYAFSMEENDGHVYVGTWNIQFDYPLMAQAISNGDLADIWATGNPLQGIGFLASEGAEVWRHDGGQNWTQVAKASPDNTGFRKMINYNGELYTASANSENGAGLWVKSDDASPQGESWAEVPWAAKNSNNNSIRALCTYTDQATGKELLYVGTENNEDGGELWTYDGTDWQLKEKFSDHAVSEVAVFKDKNGTENMYVGTWNFDVNLQGEPTDAFQLYASPDGDSFANIKPDFAGREDLSNLGVMKLIEYKGKLFLGTVNYVDGFTLLSSDDPSNSNSWNVLTTDGFGDSDQAYSWSAAIVNDMLMVGTFSTGLNGGVYSDILPLLPMDGRAQLLYSTDGVNFAVMVDDGFGAEFNYGFRSMLASGDQLFIGTASNFFIPDGGSSLYDPYQLILGEYIANLLGGIDFESLNLSPQDLELYLARLFAGNGPFIGTQIWVGSAPVPEPATILFLGTGLAGLAGSRLRRKKK
ncbi:MAG: PEP-CTERM sorting domain-containing protein [Thermodesulfobacteriota bacterium]